VSVASAVGHELGSTRGTGRPRIGAGVVGAVIVRPDLWGTAIGVVRRFAVPGWWRRPPCLPLPSPGLWRFRMITAYGDPEARPTPSDTVDYLEWCRGVAGPRRTGLDVAARAPRRRGVGGDG
jgi:hypothetical protein